MMAPIWICVPSWRARMEKLFFGFDHGGAEDDAWQITLMLDDIDGDEALEKRLRRIMSWLW
jgi:hypothetical protein